MCQNKGCVESEFIKMKTEHQNKINVSTGNTLGLFTILLYTHCVYVAM